MKRDKTHQGAGLLTRGLLVLAILVHVLFLVSLKTGWLSPLFDDSSHRFGPGGDFFSIYASGVQAVHGKGVYLLGGHVGEVPYAYPFRYAPMVAYTLAAALTCLPAISAYGLWLILCEFVLLRNIRLTMERAPDRKTACLGAAMWLVFTPYFLELFVGQFTFLTASLAFWAYLAWEEGSRTGKAGTGMKRLGDLCWAAAFWLKMMPLLFVPIALLRGRWKSVVIGIVVLLATSGFYFACFPADWKLFVSLNVDPHPIWNAGNEGLMAFLYAVAHGNMNRDLPLKNAVTLLVGSGLLWLWWVAWRQRTVPDPPRVASTPGAGQPQPSFERAMLLLYAGCSATLPLVFKDVWEHHYVLLLPPLVLMAIRKERAWLWLPAFLIAALPTLFGLYDISDLFTNEDPQNYWKPAISLLHHGWKPASALWMFSGALLCSFKMALSPSAALRWQAWRNRAGVQVALRTVRRGAELAACLVLLLLVRWTSASILAQRQATRHLVVPFETLERQHRRETCGPAALAAVGRFYGVPATEEEIARLAGTTPSGTSMLGLLQAARAKGLTAEGWKVTADQLARVPRPCILFLHPGHFIVLTGVKDGNYYVADPAQGQRAWTLEELTRSWKGEVMPVGPPDYTPEP